MALIDKLNLKRWFSPYRLIVAGGFIAAAVLILSTPLQLPDPDDWAYYTATKNFSAGHFTITTNELYKQAYEIGKDGGILLQYLPIAPNKFALEKAPGAVFYLIPFYKMHIPRWSNVLLALGMVIVTYILLKRMRDEKTAMVGSLLTLFTPISLVMYNRIWMDTFGSLAFLVIGGGLYIYYHLERDRISGLKGGILLFLAFFFTGWSVITRYTNAPVALVLGLHYVIIRLVDWRRGKGTGLKPEIIPLILGIGLPVASILLYDYFIFGSPFKYGYAITPYPIKFAFQYLGKVDAHGVSIPAQIFKYDSQAMMRNLLIGFPLLIIGIPGFIAALYFKFFRRRWPEGTWSSLRSELPWDIILVLAGWFICVFGLYLCYEWTAALKDGGGFVLFDRFLLPGLFPAVIISALIMARFPYKVLIPVLAILLVYGVLMYLQWNLNLHLLPDWLTKRTLEGRWPGYGFPPWTKSGIQFYKP
jgi:hypothetical protein